MFLSLGGGQDGLHPARQDASWEQHLAPAAQAFKANIGAQADNFPFISTTGMRLAQPHPVVEIQVRQHRGHYNIRMQLKRSNPVIEAPSNEPPESQSHRLPMV
jgi:hypothetical protein